MTLLDVRQAVEKFQKNHMRKLILWIRKKISGFKGWQGLQELHQQHKNMQKILNAYRKMEQLCAKTGLIVHTKDHEKFTEIVKSNNYLTICKILNERTLDGELARITVLNKTRK